MLSAQFLKVAAGNVCGIRGNALPFQGFRGFLHGLLEGSAHFASGYWLEGPSASEARSDNFALRVKLAFFPAIHHLVLEVVRPLGTESSGSFSLAQTVTFALPERVAKAQSGLAQHFQGALQISQLAFQVLDAFELFQ